MNFIKELLEMDTQGLDEGVKRVFKKRGEEIIRYYRCTAGPKKGKYVADPASCGLRKDPKKVRHGRKVAKTKKGVRIRKSRITKNTALSKMVQKMNSRLN